MINSYGYPRPPDRDFPGSGGEPVVYQPVPVRRRSRRRVIVLTALSTAFVLCCAAVGFILISRTQHPVAPHPTHSETTALQQWWAGAQGDFTRLQTASDDVDKAFSTFRPGALAQSCQRIHDAAEVGMLAHLPSPNADLTAELRAAVEDFHYASHLCLAVSRGSPTNYDGEFFSSMSEGNKHLRSAQDLINKLLTDV